MSSTEDPDSERKFVTILRADLVHSTDLIAELDPEQAISRLEPGLAAMRAAVRQFGGIVSKELGDGLTAVFGAPVADDNHGPLACHAALELVRRVAALGDTGLQVRVGLHSGFVVTYVVASEFSKVYEIGGAAQHLAARLEAAAEPGQIYASEACQKLAEGYVQFEYLGRKSFRGFAEPVPVYRVIDASDFSSWHVRKSRSVSRFVNRTHEIAELRRAAETVDAGGRTVCLTGEPGMGKSRLAHEFVQELKATGWQLIEAGCSPNLQGVPFAALKQIFRSIDDVEPDGRGGASIVSRLRLPPILRSAVDTVLDRPISDQEWERLEPQQRGRAIDEASRALVQGMAERQRTLLLIEDLHWIDRASDAVLASLHTHRPANLLILLTSRPGGIPEWIDRSGAVTLALRALDEESGRAMLDAILGMSPTTSDLKARIIRHTANVPLFVEEVCRGFKETGVLHGRWGELALAKPVEQLGIPTSVQGVIASRLDRVPKAERALLQIAAALGPRSTVAVLRQVAALPEALLGRALTTLDRGELLVRVDGASEETVEFPHDMIRQVTYDSMIERTRERVHARIFSSLENNAGWFAEPERLCYHATRSRNWAGAFGYGRTVARKAVARSAFADAASYFQIAMDALDKIPVSREREAEAIDLRMEARMAFMGSGKIAEWLDLGKEAERRAGSIDDLGRKVAAMTVRAAAQNFYGTPVEAVETGEEVVRLAEQWGDVGWLNLAEYGLGQAYFIAGRYRDAVNRLDRACGQLMSPQARAPLGTTAQYLLLMCCMMKSLAHAAMGEVEAAGAFQQRALEIADDSGRPFDRVAAGYSRGNWLLCRGDAAAALIVLDEAYDLAQEHGVKLFLPVLACHRGMAYLELERAEEALSVLRSAVQLAQSVGYKSTELRSAIYLAFALFRTGDSETPAQMLREVVDAARQQGFSGLEAEALLYQAMVAPADQRNRTARESYLRASIAISDRSEAGPLRAKAEALLAVARGGAPL